MSDMGSSGFFLRYFGGNLHVLFIYQLLTKRSMCPKIFLRT